METKKRNCRKQFHFLFLSSICGFSGFHVRLKYQPIKHPLYLTRKYIMKKLAVVGLVILTGLGLAGCVPETVVQPGDSEGFSRSIVTAGGQQFDCIFENEDFSHATMSCKPLDTQDGLGKSDTEDFTRDIVTVGGEKFDCLFKHRNFSHGTMWCQPVKK